MKRLTLDDAIGSAKQRGGKCLSTTYKNTRTKLLWECKSGHKWEALLRDVRSNKSWCRKCYEQGRKLGLKEAQEIAKSFNGKCLSKVYIDCSSYMTWECKKGHIWESKLSNIKHHKIWCNICSGYINNTEVANNVAKKKNGKCLSKTYINNKEDLLWECEKKHRWYARLDNVKNGTWCPECKTKIYKTQGKLKKILEDILKSKSINNYKKFKWLRNPKTGRPMEIDIWFPKLNLAVEYDGEHHFKPVQFGGISIKRAKENLKSMKKRDKAKNTLIKKNKKEVKYFIRFSYKDNLSSESVLKKLKKCGVY